GIKHPYHPCSYQGLLGKTASNFINIHKVRLSPGASRDGFDALSLTNESENELEIAASAQSPLRLRERKLVWQQELLSTHFKFVLYTLAFVLSTNLKKQPREQTKEEQTKRL